MLRILTCLALLCSLPAQVTYYAGALDGAQEVPPVVTPGGGFVTVRLEEPANTVRVFAHWFGLPGAPTAAHLHMAPAGVNGGVILPLAPGAGVNTFTGAGTLTPAQVAALKSAGTYVNLHTAANPGGELRGQVVTAVSTRFTAVLDGAQEVPPVATNATGRADAYLHEPDNRLVYCIETSGLAGITAAHLHNGAAGVNGGVIFPLTGSGGVYCGVSPRLTAAQVASLLADGTYFNIHTGANPGGEIRGQVLKDPGSDFTATLDGAQQVPPVVTAAVGSGSLHIDKNGDAHVVVSYAGLSGAPFAAHIHQAPVGSNGGIAVPLAASGGQFVATFTPTAAQLAALRAGNWYFNIHTPPNPGGEIRGQLGPVTLPSTFGPSCPGSSGQRAEIGATGFAGPGSSVDVELYDALPGAAAFLALGFDRDSSALGPLPLPFSTVGLNAPCFFLLDPVTALLSFADANGCATRPLGFGFVSGALGLEVYGQWIVLDAGANPAGLATTNALTLTLQ